LGHYRDFDFLLNSILFFAEKKGSGAGLGRFAGVGMRAGGRGGNYPVTPGRHRGPDHASIIFFKSFSFPNSIVIE